MKHALRVAWAGYEIGLVGQARLIETRDGVATVVWRALQHRPDFPTNRITRIEPLETRCDSNFVQRRSRRAPRLLLPRQLTSQGPPLS